MMNRPSLRDIKKEATAHALADAAFELARERGMDGFVVEDVAQRAGYSRRTFANHFSCKEEAVAMSAVTITGGDDAMKVLEGIPAVVSPIDVLQHLLSTQFTAGLLRRLSELIALSKVYPTLEPFNLNVFRSLQTAAQETLVELFHDRYPESYNYVIVGAVYGAILPVLEGNLHVLLPGQSAEDAPNATKFDEYLETVFGYLRKGF